MTSSSAFTLLSNNSQTASSLPSPPLTHQHSHLTYYDKRMLTFTVDRALSPSLICNGSDRSGMLSDTRYTSNTNRRRDVAELRPFFFNPVSDNNNINRYQLPPIQNFMVATPLSSPSSTFDNYYSASSSSPNSSIASSPTPLDEDDVDQELNQATKHQQIINIRRKGSIASILNSDPELRQLDEEESKCNYQSHFIDNHPPFCQTSLKRGRPRQDQIEAMQQQSFNNAKRQRLDDVQITKNHALDCVQQQACQSSSLGLVDGNANPSSINNCEIPRAARGLRHFSKQVCDKVAEKGVTTYNEVADELAQDIQNSVGNEKQHYDQKNIRRRVYDALNVFMAMDIIAKDKKVIRWLGMPERYKQRLHDNQHTKVVNFEESHVETSKRILLAQIEQEELRQKELIHSLDILKDCVNKKLAKHLLIRNLVSRNQRCSKQKNLDDDKDSRVSLPFFIVACPTNTLAINSNHGQSKVVAFQHETQCSHYYQVVYEGYDVLQQLKLNDGDSVSYPIL